MARTRVKEYVDVYLSIKDMKRLRKGYTLLKHTNGNHIALHRDVQNRGTVRRIEKLKAKIKELEGRK